MPATNFLWFDIANYNFGTGAQDLRASGDVLKIYLTNATPSASGDTVKADLAEITIENGYTGPLDILNVWTQSVEQAILTGTSIEWEALTGGFGPFRYAVLWNSTVDALIGWYDYGSSETASVGEVVGVTFLSEVLSFEH